MISEQYKFLQYFFKEIRTEGLLIVESHKSITIQQLSIELRTSVSTCKALAYQLQNFGLIVVKDQDPICQDQMKPKNILEITEKGKQMATAINDLLNCYEP
jgi:predicted transcriptional regulator